MANIPDIRDDILPEQITIDNIDDWDQKSENAINLIESDLQTDQNTINHLINTFGNKIENYHYIGELSERENNVPKYSVFFIIKQEIEGEI